MTCTHEEKGGEWKTREATSLAQFGSGKQRLRQKKYRERGRGGPSEKIK